MNDRELARALVRAVPGGGRDRRGGAIITVDEVALPLTVDQRDGGLRVRLPTVDLDGATLRLRARARVMTPPPGSLGDTERVASTLGAADVIRDGCDPALLAAWIDPAITEALPQLLWVHEGWPLRTYSLEVSGATLTIGAGVVEVEARVPAIEHVAAAVDLAAVVATRPYRLARELGALAQQLRGVVVGTRWGLDGELAIVVRGGRGGRADVVIDFVRHVPALRVPGLHTRIWTGRPYGHSAVRYLPGIADHAALAAAIPSLPAHHLDGPYR